MPHRNSLRKPLASLLSPALLLLATTTFAQQVSVRTLLPEMTELMYLTRRPSPAYTEAQASSYDRASTKPGLDTWFANGDAGQFVRVENVGGRKEYVLADLKGPGAVVRFWSANPAGTVRFYFDGEETPRFVHKLRDLLTGKVPPLSDPFGYGAAEGTDLYFPFPYAKSLKITVDDTDEDKAKALYYHVNYRTYAPGTSVATFTPGELTSLQSALKPISTALQGKGTLALGSSLKETPFAAKIAPGKSAEIARIKGEGMVRLFTARIPFPLVQTIKEMDWSDPHQPHNVLRSLWLEVKVDGETTISAPLGDFFGSAPGLLPYSSLPMMVAKDGTMTCLFPMPIGKELRASIQNLGPIDIPVSTSFVFASGKLPENSYRFHAHFNQDYGKTRPFRDLHFLDAQGEGFFVGTHLHVTNPTGAWWGEGDEKVYVDGETFPSTFGTGSEDYYGYAWCSPTLFQRAYHGQTRCDGPANFGHTSVYRWQLFDAIPFKKSFKFDIEMWHWQDVLAGWSRVTYWYAAPGGRAVEEKVPALADLLPKYTPLPAVAGALEGENLNVVSKTGGNLTNQTGFWELSKGAQLFWTEPVKGDKLVLKFPVAKAGRYEVVGNFCVARDYGIHQFRVNGSTPTAPIDFHGEGITWRKVSLGTFDLPAGESTLEVECLGKHPDAVPGQMMGLDYLLLEAK